MKVVQNENVSADHSYYQVSDGFMTREIAGEVLVVPVGEQTARMNGMVTFSESGAFLWKLLAERQTKETLVRRLSEEYQVPSEDIEQDVEAFLEGGIQRGLLTLSDME